MLDAFLDEKAEYLPGKSTMVICSYDISLLKFFLGLINSKLTFFYIRIKYSSSSYCGGISFTKDMINNFPIKIEENIKQPVISLVDKILAAKKENSSADTSAEERQIDLLVYRLYNLTFEEAKIIDNTLTEEEFNRGV